MDQKIIDSRIVKVLEVFDSVDIDYNMFPPEEEMSDHQKASMYTMLDRWFRYQYVAGRKAVKSQDFDLEAVRSEAQAFLDQEARETSDVMRSIDVLLLLKSRTNDTLVAKIDSSLLDSVIRIVDARVDTLSMGANASKYRPDDYTKVILAYEQELYALQDEANKALRASYRTKKVDTLIEYLNKIASVYLKYHKQMEVYNDVDG